MYLIGYLELLWKPLGMKCLDLTEKDFAVVKDQKGKVISKGDYVFDAVFMEKEFKRWVSGKEIKDLILYLEDSFGLYRTCIYSVG